MAAGVADEGRKKRGSTFLKMFRFDKARTPKSQDTNLSSQVDMSIDYANYLLDIQEGKMHIMNSRRESTRQKQSLIKGDVQKETIDFYDLRDNGGAQTETHKIQAQIKKTANVEKEFKTLQEVN